MLKVFFDPKREQFSEIKFERLFQNSNDKDIYIYEYKRDQEGNLWGCTNMGLTIFDEQKNVLSHYWEKNSQQILLPTMNVHHFYEDKKGDFWLAGENLTYWNRTTNEKRVFSFADGFVSNQLHAVYPDDFGNLWLSSENGIVRFNLLTHEIRTWFESDGISNNEFNRISHFQDKDGTIYFGGIEGVTVFHPKDFQGEYQKEIEDTDLIITDFEQFSREKNAVVHKMEEIIAQGSITLQPDDGFFRIQFTLTNYQDNNQIRYDYKIDGNQEEWTTIRENYLRVSGLPYGNYTLHIRAKFPFGGYAKQEITIPINVLRPFYLQSWFFISSSLLILGLAFLGYKIRVRQLKNQTKELQLLVQERTQTIEAQKATLEASNASKDRLFAIIAHDMRNAVYAFKNVTKTIQTFIKFNQPEKILRMSSAIDTSSNRLQHLLDNLLEWALAQRGELPYEPESLPLRDLVENTLQNFTEMAQEQQVILENKIPLNLALFADKNSMETVIRNLIENSLKFTPASGKITISAQQTPEYLRLTIEDTGIGMDEKTLKKLFDSYRKKARQGLNGQKGSGLGLLLVKELVTLNHGNITAKSKEEKGTCFVMDFV